MWMCFAHGPSATDRQQALNREAPAFKFQHPVLDPNALL